MKIYVLLDEFYRETHILGVFSTIEKAIEHAKTMENEGGYQYIIEKELDDPYAPDKNPV